MKKFVIIFVIISFAIAACKRDENGTSFSFSDQTAEAVALVDEANKELTKIKKLYREHEGKREEIKKAMAANDAETVRKIADDVVYLINDGMASAKAAVEKIEKAQDMDINSDYKEYLRLKQLSLSLQIDAFENYRQAARTLRDKYDPKNDAMRETVKNEFESKTDNYRKIMENARDFSNQANELAKDAIKRSTEKSGS